MKSERRHELKENVLEHDLVRLWGWVKRHANALSWGLLAVAIAALIGVWMYRSHQTAIATEQVSYQSALVQLDQLRQGLPTVKATQVIEDFEKLSNDAKDRGIAADSARRVGDAYAAMAAGDETTTAADRADLSAKAKTAYERVIKDFSDQKDAVWNAEWGMAELMSTDRNFAQAKVWAEKVQNDTPAGHPLHDRAAAFLASLPQLETPVAMATTRPSTEPATAPATSSAPATAPAKAPATKPATAPK